MFFRQVPAFLPRYWPRVQCGYHLDRLNQRVIDPAQQFCAILGIHFLQANTDGILNCRHSNFGSLDSRGPDMVNLSEG